MRLLAAAAERAMRLVERPPLVTSVVAHENILTIRSYVTGLTTAMASWNGENIHFFMVATIALSLAVPVRRMRTRLRLACLALIVGLVATLLICVVQLETVAETYAGHYIGITLHTVGEKTLLKRTNEALITVGMLLLPAYLFLVSYLAMWAESARPAGAKTGAITPPGPRRRTPSRTVMACVGGGVMLAVVWTFLAATRSEPDPRAYLAGWAKLADLNPHFAPAHVNVGNALEEEGRFDEAIRAYRRALESDPEGATARYNLGNVLMRKGLYAEAAQAYEMVLDRESDNAPAHKNLGIALLYLDRPCDALTHLERSADLDPRIFGDDLVAGQIASLRPQCSH
ncbi:MAG: tetratricopeptide repeat protein [Acidobacteria bacterium]|nr:tetratricopeptide repeat protein [Acidobacteriota bacterium]